MSEENIEIVRKMYEAYVRGDMDRALAFFHEDVEADFSIRVDSGVSTGRDELAKVVGSWIGAWDDYQEEIDEVHDFGSAICLVVTQRGRGKGSGVELANQFATVYEFTDGLITGVTMFDSREKALEAAKKAAV